MFLARKRRPFAAFRILRTPRRHHFQRFGGLERAAGPKSASRLSRRSGRQPDLGLLSELGTTQHECAPLGWATVAPDHHALGIKYKVSAPA